MENKFKIGDIVIFKNYFGKNSKEWDNIGFVSMYNNLIINKKYKVSRYCEANNSLKIEGFLWSIPANSFELCDKNKVNVVIKKLKEDLLNQELTIKTNNEQRIILRALCQELNIPHYGLVYPQYNNFVDIDNSYKDLYTTWSKGNPDTLFYSNYYNEKVLINFEDLVAGFNQFKK